MGRRVKATFIVVIVIDCGRVRRRLQRWSRRQRVERRVRARRDVFSELERVFRCTAPTKSVSELEQNVAESNRARTRQARICENVDQGSPEAKRG